MADVVRLLPRLWDGQRALRFLAGLAMLALAFAANAGLIGPAALPAGPAQLTAAAQPAASPPVEAAFAQPAASAPVEAAPAQRTASAPQADTAPASAESVTLVEKAATDIESAASSEAAAVPGVSAVLDGHHGTVALGDHQGAVGSGVNALVLAGLGLLVVVVWTAGPGAGRFAGGMPAQRGPPQR